MSKLRMTLIDVGWGDSILLEFENDAGHTSYGLIDSNDTSTLPSSRVFLRRYFERQERWPTKAPRLFDFVLLSHFHSDHYQGLKPLLRLFGTERFWYPKTHRRDQAGALLSYCNSSSKVRQHEALDTTKLLPVLHGTAMKVLWPRPDRISPPDEENDNSVVLALTLDNVTFLLTGDAEEAVWHEISRQIPDTTRVVKVPHHGSRNGTFDGNQGTPWLDACPAETQLGVSSHLRPHGHPHDEVIWAFAARNHRYYRTDRHYHVTFETDGTNVQVTYSH